MPNNFRLTGDYYVSKEGNDLNDGLTAETPLLTVQAALNKVTTAVTRRIIIGSGVYKETLSKNIPGDIIIYLLADGKVTFQTNTPAERHFFNTVIYYTAGKFYFSGIEFLGPGGINYTCVNTYGGFFEFVNCIFNSCDASISPLNNSGFVVVLRNCILLNSSINGPYPTITLGNVRIDKCVLINSQINVGSGGNVGNCINSYFDSTSTILLASNLAYFTPFNYNNIQGKIVALTSGSVSGVNSIGVAQTLAQSKIDYPLYFANSFSSAPKFNDPLNLNFTLQSDSPHIRAASDYTNIGGTEYAVYKSSSSTELTSGATISGLTLRGNNSYTITSSPTAGTLETAPIFLQWPATKPLTKLEWAGSLEFNKSITAGTVGNNNVPDWDTYTTGAGASPDRLTVKMRFSTQQTIPTLSSHWDNGGYWTAGNYELFEVNAKPKVDSNGKGNGNPDYIESSGLGDIVPTWIQINVKLIDTYNP